MKRIIAMMLCMGVLVMACPGCGQRAGEDIPVLYRGEITLRLDNSFGLGEPMIDIFNQEYPDITVHVEEVGQYEYMDQLAQDVASGTQLPDVLLTTKTYLARAKELDCFADLTATPYQYDSARIIDYASTYLHDGEALIGLPVCIYPVVLCYRTDVAEQVLGTSDPDVIAGMMVDWDGWISLGEQVKAVSGGDVYLFPSLMEASGYIWDSSGEPWIQDGEILIEENYMEEMGLLERLTQADVCLDLAPSWDMITDSAAQGTVLFYRDLDNDFIREYAPSTEGRWRYILPPIPVTGQHEIYAHVTKDARDPQAAYLFIQYLCGSDEGTIALYGRTGCLPGIKSVYEEGRLEEYAYANHEDIPLSLYRDYLEGMEFRQLSPYDEMLTSIVLDTITNCQRGAPIDRTARSIESAVRREIQQNNQ